MQEFATKVDNVGDTLGASGFNAFITELENICKDLGFTLDPEGGPDTDLDMLGKALAMMGSGAEYYADSGSANTYVLSRVGNMQSVRAYFDGMRITFLAGNVNTSSSTINVGALGAKSVVLADGSALAGGEITADNYTIAVYRSGADRFEMFFNKSETSNPGFISGLVPSNSGADADHDIEISTGICRDSLDSLNLLLTSVLIKQIDAIWAVGTNAGGLFSGTVANDTTYHIFAIRKDSDGSIDAGFDTSISAANIPAGYTSFRRVGSVVTDGSANILAFYATETDGGGIDVDWDVYTADFSGNIALTRVLRTLTVPTGIEVIAKITAGISGTTTDGTYWVKPTFITDSAPSPTNFDLKTAADNAAPGISKLIKTDTSGQIASRGTVVTSHQILTQGFIDRRIS